jgi:hypothetical protein
MKEGTEPHQESNKRNRRRRRKNWSTSATTPNDTAQRIENGGKAGETAGTIVAQESNT